jgi:hypothetical protein
VGIARKRFCPRVTRIAGAMPTLRNCSEIRTKNKAKMHQTLRLHPDSSCFAVTHVEVEIARPQTRSLVLAYVVTGRISDVAMPAVDVATRTDELWRHTCFEAFVGAGVAYYEFNFAPSRHWASYRFSSYRTGMRVATEIGAPHIAVEWSPKRYTLLASLELDQLLLSRDATLRLGLSAVIEENSGHRSYWALAHPPGKADFHHSDCFTLELSQPCQS